MVGSDSLELVEVAASTSSLATRAHEMLDSLRRLVPFDTAWMALADPLSSSYTGLASVDLDERTQHYLGGPKMAHDIEVTGTDRARPPLSVSDLAYPAADLPTWAECLHPAGLHEALAVALFDTARRHIGFLSLLYGSEEPPSPAARHRLHQLTRVLAHGIDPLRPLSAAAQMVRGATAGAVLMRTSTQPLPGLDGDALLAEGSPVIAVARSYVDDGHPFMSFLWPRGGRHAPNGHVRVTVLTSPGESPVHALGAVILSPVNDLRGLTPRELEVLGLVIDGCSNPEIAHALSLAPRTVATHLEHILIKFDAPSRTLAAVRAEREGLYVPVLPFLSLG